jgi:signal transduction histidine kinase
LDNAIKYRGDEPPRIELSIVERKSDWHFSLRDNGVGIRTEDLQRVFVVFERVSRDHDDGTGIGLAICKKIVELHGGSIWVESEPGQGSTFHFTLPVRSKFASSQVIVTHRGSNSRAAFSRSQSGQQAAG